MENEKVASERHYRSGESIQVGDVVRAEEALLVVEAIITRESPQWEEYWKQHGEGLLLAGPPFGTLFVTFDRTEIEFISRGAE